MKCKVFNIRVQNFGVQKVATATDEEKINEFLNKNSVINYYATLVNDRSTFWSILIFYDEYNNDAQEYIDDAFEPPINYEKEILSNLRKMKSK